MDLARALGVNTEHVEIDQLPWVRSRPGMELRYIHVSRSRGLTVLQMRAQPFVKTELHRHLGFVLGLTTKGRWSHDPADFLYKPNSYISEPNEVHQFFNGPEVSEVYFISGGGETEYYDPEGREVVRRSGESNGLDWYFRQCEAQGLPRMNVLSD